MNETRHDETATSHSYARPLDLDSLDEWAFEVGNEPVLALIERLRETDHFGRAEHYESLYVQALNRATAAEAALAAVRDFYKPQTHLHRAEGHECEVPDISLYEDTEAWTCPVCGRYWVPTLEWGHNYHEDGREWRPERP